ncbi:hypothetical protein FB451DRAFT_514525 [Mycena latifolia]|nr:hypothetical protein FB451DRAFT_514525 [Mycena latifolia]
MAPSQPRSSNTKNASLASQSAQNAQQTAVPTATSRKKENLGVDLRRPKSQARKPLHEKDEEEDPLESATPIVEDPPRASSPDWDYELVEEEIRLSDMLARQTREARNAHRREARREAARADPDAANIQRQESGRARVTLVAEFWLSQLRARAAKQRAVLDELHIGAGLDLLQRIAAVHFELTHQLPIPPTAPVWRDFSPGVVQFLLTVARAPTSYDISPFVANGTVVKCYPDDAPPHDTVYNYLRRIRVADPKKALHAYLAKFPATAAITILQLVLQGDICVELPDFKSAMAELGLEEAVDVLIEELKINKDMKILDGAHRGVTGQSSYPYTGITWTVPPCWDDVIGPQENPSRNELPRLTAR